LADDPDIQQAVDDLAEMVKENLGLDFDDGLSGGNVTEGETRDGSDATDHTPNSTYSGNSVWSIFRFLHGDSGIAVRSDTLERILATVDTAGIDATITVAMEIMETRDNGNYGCGGSAPSFDDCCCCCRRLLLQIAASSRRL